MKEIFFWVSGGSDGYVLDYCGFFRDVLGGCEISEVRFVNCGVSKMCK